MPFRIFSIPMLHSAAAEAELNAFLRSHPVLEITRRWVDRGRNSFWCLSGFFWFSGISSLQNNS
jgi:hypothetical protein